jgi:hypothetical protein
MEIVGDVSVNRIPDQIDELHLRVVIVDALDNICRKRCLGIAG